MFKYSLFGYENVYSDTFCTDKQPPTLGMQYYNSNTTWKTQV